MVVKLFLIQKVKMNIPAFMHVLLIRLMNHKLLDKKEI